MALLRDILNNNVDPTKTVTYRAKFVSDFAKRFNVIKRVTLKSIIDNDCFGYGIEDDRNNGDDRYDTNFGETPLAYRQLQNLPNFDKVVFFLDWLEETEEKSFFEKKYLPYLVPFILPLWANLYLDTFYKRGILWSRQRVKADSKVLKYLGLEPENIDTSAFGILASVQTENHTNALVSILNKNFDYFTSVKEDLNKSIKIILKDGIEKGIHPRIIGKEISNKISTIGIHRGTLIARTEAIRSHHIASINEYENLGLKTIIIKAEWTTAKDSRVCQLCKPLEGKVFELNEIRNKIPLHPQCRCAALPYIES